jgi:Cu+-exporting ATPase
MDDSLRDPVCGMEVTYQTAQARSEYDGQTYYFCSLDCKEQFDRDPERYVAEQESHQAHH